MKVYLAGPLFNATERRRNEELCATLESWGFEVYLPQRDSGLLGVGTAVGRDARESIRAKDLAGLESCEAVVAVMEGEALDPGTCYEIGWAEAKDKHVCLLCEDSRRPYYNLNAMFSFACWCADMVVLKDVLEGIALVEDSRTWCKNEQWLRALEGAKGYARGRDAQPSRLGEDTGSEGPTAPQGEVSHDITRTESISTS